MNRLHYRKSDIKAISVFQFEKGCDYINIIGKSECTAKQMAEYLIARNPNAKSWALTYANIYLEEGETEGVRGDGAWIQSCIETGNFKFSGGTAVTFNQNNFCGLGVTSKGKKGHSFSTPRIGIRAQIQHLKGYATSVQLKSPCVDPRYNYISPKGKAPRFEDLSGKWAVPGYDTKKASSLEDAMKKGIGYGFDIINGINQMKKIKDNIVEEDNKKMAYKVAIDAGHGSNTAGKRTPDGYREHWINVKCAYFFDLALKRCGFNTLKVAWNDTNSADDVDVPLTTRQNQIKNAKCDISVSWHANAYGDGKNYNTGQGIETLIHNSSSVTKDSLNLANKIQSKLIQGTVQKNRGVKTQNLAMCNCSLLGTTASVLIEIGFMTNEYEANLMKTDAFCMECAEEAAQGVCDYFKVPYIKNNVPNKVVDNPTTNSGNTSSDKLYRVRKSWANAASQLGAWKSLESAKRGWKAGYYVFDDSGNVVYPISSNVSSTETIKETYQIKLLEDLNIRKTPNGTIMQVNGAKKGIIYTIVETQGVWGRLKSGAGWINVSDSYVKRI